MKLLYVTQTMRLKDSVLVRAERDECSMPRQTVDFRYLPGPPFPPSGNRVFQQWNSGIPPPAPAQLEISQQGLSLRSERAR